MKKQPLISENTAFMIAKVIKEEYENNPQLLEEFEKWKNSEEAKLYA